MVYDNDLKILEFRMEKPCALKHMIYDYDLELLEFRM
jgi:hypothetical protein